MGRKWKYPATFQLEVHGLHSSPILYTTDLVHLHSQCMENTYHDHHCRKMNKNANPLIRNHILERFQPSEKHVRCLMKNNSGKELL